MDEYYQYYQLEHDCNGWILSLYDTDEGFLEIIEYCNFLDIDKLKEWCSRYGFDMPSYDDIIRLCQEYACNHLK